MEYSDLLLVLDAGSVAAALLAALYWYRSARVEIPKLIDIPMAMIQEPFRRAAKLSSRAALAAAFSAAFQAVSLAIS